MIFHFYSDPSHGWLKVQRKKLESLGITQLITTCSYQRGDWVYLEEDLDAGTFLDAWKATGKTVTIRHHSTNKSSRFRNYDSYTSGSAGSGVVSKDAFAKIPVKTGNYGLVQNPETGKFDTKKYVGDFVAFKADTEQYGKITNIQGNGKRARLTIENPDGFPGDYLRYATEAQMDADDCWAE